MRQSGWRLAVKQVSDRVIAGCALTVLSPVLGMTAIAVRIGLGSPVFFRQARPGRHGREITVVKLRTMRDLRAPSGELLPDSERMTALGRFLRATSLDEIPQLWNVLSGELSLVGPRPLLTRYLDRYSPEQARRHEVLPGITGWAQVHGRNAISWEQKLAMDVWYVDHWSLLLDLRIMLLTALHMLRRDGISHQGHVTMPEFMGEGGQ